MKTFETVRSCGVGFNVWENMNADGKSSGKYEYTSLLGNDKKTLFRLLPSKLRIVIHEETCSTVIKIWEDYYNLYTMIGKEDFSHQDIGIYFDAAKAWIQLFVSLSARRKGYTRARVTPYMHPMEYHVPHFFNLHRTIFWGQGEERTMMSPGLWS